MLRKFRNLIKDTAIIFILSLSGFFVMGEAYFRIFKKDSPCLFVPTSNEKLVYEYNKKFGNTGEINSYGMRDKEFNLHDIEDYYKIAVLGDSHTASFKVKNIEDTFPSQIEKYLNAASPHKPVRVLNFGVPGYNTAQELEALKSKVLAFQPKLVILQYCLNDTHVCNYIQPANKALNSLIYKSKLLVRLWEKFLYSSTGEKPFYEWVGRRFPDLLLYSEGLVGTRKPADDETPEHKPHPPRTKDRVPARYHYMLGEENWRKHIAEFAQVCRQNNILLLATGFIGEKERAIFSQAGFNVYSFNDIFKNQDMRNYGVDPDDTSSHFDGRGCHVIGKALAEYIAKNNLMKN